MDHSLIGSIIIGCLSGFFAGKIMRGGGFGCLINLLLGLVGSFVGGRVFSFMNIQWGGTIGALATATIGAVIVLWIASFFISKE